MAPKGDLKWLQSILKTIVCNAFNEINIDEQPEFVEKVIEMGFRAAPVITKDDFAFSGFRPSELAKLA